MSRGVQWSLLGSAGVAALVALAGCSHYLYGERETWRGEAEVACLNSGAVKESPERVRLAAIDGPGICGMDYPLRVSALGDSAPLGYEDEPLRPPAAIPDAALPQRWPLVQSNALPPPASPIQSAIQPPAIRSTAFRTAALWLPAIRFRAATSIRHANSSGAGQRSDIALSSRRSAA